MKLINHILYIEFTELVSCGISENTLKSVKNKGVNCWKFINDPSDKRKVLAEYESLKPVYKDLIIAKYGNPYEAVHQSAIKEFLKYDQEAFKFYSNYVLANGEGLPTEHKELYIKQAEWLNLLSFDISRPMRALGCKTKPEFYGVFIRQAEFNNVGLPTNYSKLRTKLRTYATDGYQSLISGKFGNNNTEKICEAAADWLIAKYALPIKMNTEMLWFEYNSIAPKKNWKPLKDSRSVHAFLNRPEIKSEWFGPRNGTLKHANDKYRYMLRTALPTFRDALWYSDGTKLNFFDNEGKLRASYQVYVVIDAYSEVILSYHISETENYEAIYYGYKRAIEFSQAKPYEMRYDNQGGHKKIKSFLDQLNTVGFNTRAYNGKSKTIENIFSRFQQGPMRKYWFFTGQNITAKSLNSKANIEFVMANLKNLPSPNEIKQAFADCVVEWNNSKHPKTELNRIEAYSTSINPHHKPVDYLEMVELFWLTNNREITYRNDGIKITIAGDTREYEVLVNGMPDANFRSKYIDQPFTVKYDPDNGEHIRLYKNTPAGLQFVAIAEARIVVPRAMIDRKEGDGEMIAALLNFGNEEMKTKAQKHKEREDRTGVRAEDLITSLGGQMKYESNLSDEMEEAVITDWRDLI